MPGPYSFDTTISAGDTGMIAWGEAVGEAFNEATDAATPSVIMLRDANGNAKTADPTDPAHVATKGYVDTAVSERSLYVGAFGTLGSSDDSETIIAALTSANGRTVIFPQGATLTTNDVALTAISDVVIDGNGTTLAMNATGSESAGIHFTGDIHNVTVRNLLVTGSANTADSHKGVSAHSGIVIDNLKIVDCVFEDMINGIGLNADGSGSASGVEIAGNRVHNMVGSDSGFGYGIQVAFSGNTPNGVMIHNNVISSCQRHGIYVAKCTGAVVFGNMIQNHRDVAHDGTVRCAINVMRSSQVSVIGNNIQNGYGGALNLGAIETGDHSELYTVVGNTFTNAMDAAPLVNVGSTTPSTDGIPVGIVFSGNVVRSNTGLASLMRVNSGKEITITGNTFQLLNAGTADGLQFYGSEETSNLYTDNINVANNLFDLDVTNGASKRCVRFASGHETDTSTYWFSRNRRVGGSAMFIVSAALTNPNVSVSDQANDTLTSWVAPSNMLYGVAGTVAPSAGGAGALPATPLGYLTVNVNGSSRKIAYY